MAEFDKREGEIVLSFDPDKTASDGSITFIGRLQTGWKTRADCPKNLVQARERQIPAKVVINEAYRQGLAGLEKFSHAYVLYWMHEARRDLIVQNPRHKGSLTGVFALRSPVRPNPIALAVVQILGIDHEAGVIEIDAIDCVEGTPVVDIKPWFETIDGVSVEGK